MRKVILMVCAAAMLATSTGCLIPIYSGDPKAFLAEREQGCNGSWPRGEGRLACRPACPDYPGGGD